MVRSNKKGIVESILSGVLWAAYSVTLYSLLNPFLGDTGDINSLEGITFVILAALGIGWIDALLAFIFQLAYVIGRGNYQNFKELLFSDALLKIAPAAFFAGPMGLLPFAIASRYSVSITTAITAFYPVLGSIIALFWFKDKLTPMKFLGILLAVSGVVVTSGFSGLHIVGISLAILASVGYSLELVFGYRLLADDVEPDVSLALKQVSLIVMYTVLLGILLLLPGNWAFFTNLISAVDFNAAYSFVQPVLGNVPLIWLVFLIASFFNAAAYIFYFRGMNNSGVSTASSLNIAYGVWTLIILALPPFSTMPTTSAVIGAVLTFSGAVVVIIESNKIEKEVADSTTN